jgi:hypothetical protein
MFSSFHERSLQERQGARRGGRVLARIENFEICKAAFEKALFVYPKEHLEMRQGARIILESKAY